MFEEGVSPVNSTVSIPAPVRGLNLIDSVAAMSEKDALVAENVVCYPDKVEMRKGAANHVTGFAQAVEGLLEYNGVASSSLWATTSTGIYAATTAGAVGAAAIALTQGQVTSTTLATGAGNYLFVVNGVDTLKQYDGTTWSSVAAFGGLATSSILAVETYKQRLYMLEKSSLNLHYLPVNSISGAATSYPLGAIFRRGGYLQAIATWTVDGGAGPDDHLVVMTSAGELAVFTGTDPSSAATWSLRGVYFIGRPLGVNSLYKYGADILILAEGGVYPLSKALQTAAVERTSTVSARIQPLLAEYANTYRSSWGWQLLSHPDVPFLLVNVPGTTTGLQLVMHSQTGAWSTFTGWTANCWARLNGQLYFGSSTAVVKAWFGSNDFGANIVSTCFSSFSRLRYGKNKHIKMVRPILESNGAFTLTLGVANDFSMSPATSVISGTSAASLWGTGLWGSATWSSSALLTKDWRAVPDVSGTYKATYWQVASNTSQVALLSTDYLFIPGSTFG